MIQDFIADVQNRPVIPEAKFPSAEQCQLLALASLLPLEPLKRLLDSIERALQ